MTEDRAKVRAVELVNAKAAFVIASEDKASITLEGDYALFAEHDGVLLAEDYRLRIIVPHDYPNAIPSVLEISGLIPPDYEHKYTNGALCLGVDGEIAASIASDDSLVRFLDGFVQEALYSAKYFYRFGKYPFGDRRHGESGILAYYAEFFSVDEAGASAILECLANGKYRGHLPCPCGSGIKSKYCHGSEMLAIIQSPPRQLAAKSDFKQIGTERELRQKLERKAWESLTPIEEWRAGLKRRVTASHH